MPEAIQGRVLKSGYARTVYVDAEGRVVKRFHHPNALQALRDRRRAVGERRALATLFAAELAVPRPLGVQRVRGGRWEVVMERVHGAVELAAILEGRAAAPLPPAELAARVGALLAAAQRAGLDHPDLHPGNWLVDPAGRVWLVDFHKARVRPRLPGGRRRDLAQRDLLALVAYLRETLAPGARRALIESWDDGAGPPGRRAAELGALVHAVESAARPHRRAWVAHAQGRWTRESSRCVTLPGPHGGTVYVRRGTAPAHAAALAAAVGAAVEERPATSMRTIAGERFLVAVARDAAELERLWVHAARLVEHHLPALAPAAACGRAALFALPPGAEPTPAAALDPAAAGALLGALHDRGLDVPGLEGLTWSSPAGAHLAPPPLFEHVDPAPGGMEVARRFAACPTHAPEPAFRAAYAAALRRDPAERDALD